MTDPAIPSDIAAMSFEDALEELDRVVRQLDEGRVKLDDSIAAYERGTWLRRHCELLLRQAQMKVDQISVAADGAVRLAPEATP